MSDDEKMLRLLITARDKESLSALLREQQPDFAVPRRLEGGAVSVEAYVSESRLEALRRYPVKIDVLEDTSATERALPAEGDRGNPFRRENDPVPRGFGRKVKDDGSGLP